MGVLATTWPCAEERRVRRDWSLTESIEPKKTRYSRQHHPQRIYSDNILSRTIVYQRKEVLIAIFRSLAASDGRTVEQSTNVAEDQETVTQTFDRLATRWRNETAYISSIPDLVMHPSYQAILRLPKDEVIPLILRELRDNGGFWYPALHSLTEENPVDQSELGNIKKMKNAWLERGHRKDWF